MDSQQQKEVVDERKTAAYVPGMGNEEKTTGAAETAEQWVTRVMNAATDEQMETMRIPVASAFFALTVQEMSSRQLRAARLECAKAIGYDCTCGPLRLAKEKADIDMVAARVRLVDALLAMVPQ